MVEATAASIGSSTERVVFLACRMNGLSANYGHLDLLIGRNAARDIYPHVLKWLDLHAGVDVPENRPEPPSSEEIQPTLDPDAQVSLTLIERQKNAPIPPPMPPKADTAVDDYPPTPSDDSDDELDDDLSWIDGDVPNVPKRN